MTKVILFFFLYTNNLFLVIQKLMRKIKKDSNIFQRKFLIFFVVVLLNCKCYYKHSGIILNLMETKNKNLEKFAIKMF